MGIRRILIAGVCGLWTTMLLAQAPPAAPVPAALSDLVRNLDSSDVQARLGATEELFRSPNFTLKQLESVLRESPLTVEQRQRLLGVAERRFQSEPRAAMGVRSDGNLGGQGASHGATLGAPERGFPAQTIIRAGDRVIAAGGETIDKWDTLRQVILSHDPGDELPITVVREGATLNLNVTLGEYSRLPSPSTVEPQIKAGAWQLRSRDLRGKEPAEPIQSGLPPASWLIPITPTADDAADGGVGIRNDAPDGGPLIVVAGGEPRGGVEAPIVPPMGRNSLNLRVMPGEQRIMQGPVVNPQDMAQFQAQRLQQARLLLQQQRTQMDQLNKRLADPALTPEERGSLRAELQMIEAQVRMYNEQVRMLEQRPRMRRFP